MDETRLATPADAAGVEAIYAPIVRDTAISFETEPPDTSEIAGRIEQTLAGGLPWLVRVRGDRMLGYAYAGRFRARAAYRWSVESSVFVDPGAHRAGVGRALMGSMLAILELQGYQSLYAGVTLPNPASVGLHEAMGFTRIGAFPSAGYKFGAWHDVGWWGRTLGTRAAAPAEPIPLAVARRHEAWPDALDAGDRR